ncbi:MAG: tetratricopeptide repeat protein [Flavobacteriales bacterium]|nr:tetratricopeptide repeat protein [Flavobacteriales bacterium]
MKSTFVFLLSSAFAFSSFGQSKEEAIRKTLNERYESASFDFRNLLIAQPTNGELYFFCGDNYYYWGKQESDNLTQDSAMAIFRRGIEVAPTNPMNYVGLGRSAWQKGDEAMATNQFNKAIEIMNAKSNKVDKAVQQVAYLKMAETLIQSEKKKLSDAYNYINLALKLNDKNPEVYIQLGDYHSENDGIDLSNAIRYYNQSASIDPTNTRVLLRKGQLYVKVKSWDDGLNNFNAAIAADPNFAPAHREKAELIYLAGRYKQAVESYAKYLELNNSCRVGQRYASFIFLTKDYAKAITELEKWLPCNRDNTVLYRLLGYANHEVGMSDVAMKNMNEFFVRAEKNKSPKIIGSDYAYKGKILSKMGQDSLAVVEIEKAIAMEGGYPEGYGEIAMIYSKLKNNGKAAEWFQRKIDKTTGTEIDYFLLGQSHYFNKNYAAADTAFAMTTKAYVDGFFWRGRANKNLDNQENPIGLAKPYYEEYIKAISGDPAKIEPNRKNLIESYSYLGVLYAKQDNLLCAKAAWMKVQELDPENITANQVLEDKEVIGLTGVPCDLFAVPTE